MPDFPASRPHLEPYLSLQGEVTPFYEAKAIEDFVTRWRQTGGKESAHSQPFFTELFTLMGLKALIAQGEISFEHHVYFEGESHPKRIDVYRKGVFLIEAKQGSCRKLGHEAGHGERGTIAYQRAMRQAFGQAKGYADNLLSERPPVVMVVDVGWQFDVWLGYEGHYNGYESRLSLSIDDLLDPHVFTLLTDFLREPLKRDPSRVAARVTRDIAASLAQLAARLETLGHEPEHVARFLIRCLFTMFVEDIDLLGEHMFERMLREVWVPRPETFVNGIEELWRRMDEGHQDKMSGVRIPRFNGALFRDAKGLELDEEALKLLHDAARADWSRVEPSIFGTLLERALSARERHALGAHYTPRAYIERLLRPTLEEPLRERWEAVQAHVLELIHPAQGEPSEKARTQAKHEVKAFKRCLSEVHVLDPACGSGNFLYVAFDLLKQIELEVDRLLEELGEAQMGLGLQGETVTPAQLHGIEKKPWAREIAEIVIWIGALQWYRRLHPKANPPEPILRDHRQILSGDAVMQWERRTPRLDEHGVPIRVWDQTSFTISATGQRVPDTSARITLYDYHEVSRTPWPEAHFIVGNPPFIGTSPMRQALGSGYVDALRKLYPEVPESCDYVMYWWSRAAHEVTRPDACLERFGFITTNSIRQIFARRVIRHAMGQGLTLDFAIPDHPWVDSQDGAAVRVAMTVGKRRTHEYEQGVLCEVIKEGRSGHDAWDIEVKSKTGLIQEDLRIGAAVAQAQVLRANSNLASRGMQLIGQGFAISTEQRQRFFDAHGQALVDSYVFTYLKGSDLNQKSKERWIIDLFGQDLSAVRTQVPNLVQWLERHVKPERDQNNRVTYRDKWWLFGEPRRVLRQALKGLERYVATTETSKHRFFQFLQADVVPDNMIVALAFDDFYSFGVVSSRVHLTWVSYSGGTLEDRPRYNKTRCFDPFPFPEVTEAQQEAIGQKACELDMHRQQAQAKDPKLLTMTNMYNVLSRIQAIESGEDTTPLTRKEQRIATLAEIDTRLKTLHEKLDTLVLDAYGFSTFERDEQGKPLLDEQGNPVPLSDATLLHHLVALNAQRHAEEEQGFVRWLRPDFQASDELPLEFETAPEIELDDVSLPIEPLVYPKAPQERARALKRLVKQQPGSTLEELGKFFKGKLSKKKTGELETMLQALASAGVVIQVDESRWF